mmetsp:Transcript_27031/g.28065  ORF Transcript_27031/g.28065 Transcript_27031/m.28065 type:complete len:229 (-) Transcript_27031:68-754(-)
MFKTFLNSKFKFANEIICSLGNNTGTGFNSSTIGNILINHPQYFKSQQDKYKKTTEILNEKRNRNFDNVSDREKEITLESDWTLNKNEEENTSSIERKFVFRQESHALEFISVVKDKCDEIDHHPSWTFTSDHAIREYTIRVNLTSHFNENNVSEKDYELAAYLTYEYERLNTFVFKSYFSKCAQLGTGLLFAFFIYSYAKKRYEKSYRRYNSFELKLNTTVGSEVCN